MTLLLDIGNTRLKCARRQGGTHVDAAAFAHDDPAFDANLESWLDASAADAKHAWIAAVAPDVHIARAQAALDRRGIQCRRVMTRAQALGLQVAYATPAELGVDRWLGMLAGRARARGPLLLASVGTALTIDAVMADGTHLGGLIAVSPTLGRSALLAHAPRLQAGNGTIRRFAATTADAIASGGVLAAAALIERSAGELGERAGSPAHLILTGGGAQELQPWLPPHELVPELVLEGLLCWAMHDGIQEPSR